MPTWNWQFPHWPELRFDPASLAEAETRFTAGATVLLTTLAASSTESVERIMVELVSDEAVTTSTIEGELLDRVSVQRSIRRALSLGLPDATATPAERGIAELLVDVCRTFMQPLDAETLHRWHAMVMRGRDARAEPGRWRTSAEPMQVVSGRLDRPTVHFEAPPAERVPGEMQRFIEWFNATQPTVDASQLGALARAGLAHVWFESIHPFADGNGRVGRALSEKALAQSMPHPSLTALSPVILARRGDYYRALAQASTTLDIDPWQRWFAGIALQAQTRSIAEAQFIADKVRMLAALGRELNVRQEKALLRMMERGSTGFAGGMTASKYMAITRASPATATRDLAGLVELGAVTPHGARRHMRYELQLQVRPVPSITVLPTGAIVETPPLP